MIKKVRDRLYKWRNKGRLLARRYKRPLKGQKIWGQHPIEVADDVSIPKSVYFNTRSGKIVIGAGTAFGEEVMLLTGKHLNIAEAEAAKTRLHAVVPQGRDIVIGKGVWIASRAIINGNVTIGDYAVVAAGAVVTKNVPARTVVAGVPAKVIKHL